MKQRLYRLAGLMPVVALAATLHGSPVVAQTTDQAQAWPPAASVPALQARMKSIRAETNPERRMALMEEQVKALEAAESSSRLALEATQLGYKVGVRVNLDVLNAQTQLYSTQADLAKARYEVLLTSLRLRQAAGQLRAEDIAAINQLLAK